MCPKLFSMLAVVVLLGPAAAAQQPSAAPLLAPPDMAPLATPPAGLQEPLPLPYASAAADPQIDTDLNHFHIEEFSPWSKSAWLSPDAWDTGVELGINGSSGTSESLSIRTGGYMKRESRFSKLNLKSSYNRTTEGGRATQNNAQFDVRNDWLLDDTSPWTLYGTGEVFYDEFQAFDLQTSANSGIGYRFLHEPELELIGRLGAGSSREFGGPDDRWVPESLVAFEFNEQLSPAQKYYAKLDYYPEWQEIGEFRLVADIGWQIQFAQPSNLSLKLSASDRYDSTPNGAEPHLVNYAVLLLLKL
jgi:hypothetical protein